ncbi:serine/threonine-protein kinase [Fodinibius salsisoli]|uniref:Serine/threonine protein kinase n=1 Tax=Fodinibius salsisoli TaxID=2820877 RepID=A0ABT3PMM3_9BACT|nr:serine/threonine-protein kinase [Fodinibius salsisoli]MCW9707193.1 serine/threonine protein kinase [Fodinibius salsisoli]
MGNPNWDNVETIIDEVLSLPKSKRAKYISCACKDDKQLKGKVTEFLESIFNSEGWLEDPKKYKENFYQAIADDVDDLGSTNTLLGCNVGAYTIKEELGRGGMGAVYRAERSDGTFEHQVAIKVIRSGRATPENVRRFERERNILAGLNHPGIAQLFDGGVTDNCVPYLIMEYVKGIRIDQYCEKHDLTVDKRTELFMQVLKAVMHAHENLVIHRDLKPDNILVTQQGQVKILDFGISKLLEKSDPRQQDRTLTHARVLTPKYAAPEQIKEEPVTTATDLYALGTIFYELISGNHPLQLENKSYFDTERIILEKEPPPPSLNLTTERSDLKNKIRGDLDAISCKALRKEPDQRYRMANHFLYDLTNYQQGLPISVHADSFRYRSKKFLQRNKYILAAVVGFVVLIFTFASIYTWRITEERNAAQAQASKAAQVTDFMVELFEVQNPTESLGSDVTADQLIQRGIERASKLENQPIVQAQMFSAVGRAQRRLGNYDKAENLLLKALNLRKNHLGLNHSETAKSLDHLGLLKIEAGKFKIADSLLRQSLNIQRTTSGIQQLSSAQTQYLLAYVQRRVGNYDEAEKLYRSSLSIRKQYLPENDPLILESLSGLGTALHSKGEYTETLDLFTRALEGRKKIFSMRHPDVAMSFNNLAALKLNIGQFAAAESLFKKSLQIRQFLLGDEHPKVYLTKNNLALVLQEQDKLAEAEQLFRETLKARIKQSGPNSLGAKITQFCLANLMNKTNRFHSALRLYQDVLPVFREKLSDDHSFTARTWLGMGSAHLHLGKPLKADSLMNKGFNIIRRIHKEESLERALADQEMADLKIEQQNYTEAGLLLNHALKALQAIEGKQSLRQQRIISKLQVLNL